MIDGETGLDVRQCVDRADGKTRLEAWKVLRDIAKVRAWLPAGYSASEERELWLVKYRIWTDWSHDEARPGDWIVKSWKGKTKTKDGKATIELADSVEGIFREKDFHGRYRLIDGER
jgi:hypothetical protein